MKKVENLFDFKQKKLTLNFFDTLQKIERQKLNDLKLEAKQKSKKSF